MDLRERAQAMRLADKLSAAQIADRLGVPRRTVARWLTDLPVPQWTLRPNAKDDARQRALLLRAEGWSVPDIARELQVARSTAWSWVRHRPLDRSGERSRAAVARRLEAHAAWAAGRKATTAARRESLMEAAARDVPAIGRAELLRLGAMVYWCEGAKRKPWFTGTPFQFSNTDPGLVRVFLRFLDAMQVPAADRVFRVAIHETADAEAAVRWWAGQLGVPADVFRPPTVKRHNPKTNRRNRGELYHGCLSIYVRGGAGLYWQVAGLVKGIVARVSETGSTSRNEISDR